jgi:hypothetical protein
MYNVLSPELYTPQSYFLRHNRSKDGGPRRILCWITTFPANLEVQSVLPILTRPCLRVF